MTVPVIRLALEEYGGLRAAHARLGMHTHVLAQSLPLSLLSTDGLRHLDLLAIWHL